MIATPASAAISAPPRRISASTASPSASIENATRLSAETGTAPIAYTSESALQAAIRPNWRGSSTIGVKKSTVWTIARSSRSL